MACSNCTARVLRVFLQDSLPSASTSARSAFRRPLPRRLPSRFSVQDHARHQSTLSAAWGINELPSDDDYIPFVPSPLPVESQLKPAIEDEPFAGQLHRPPAVPVIEYSEPEIELTGSAQRAANEISDEATQDEQTSGSELERSTKESSTVANLEELGLPIVGKEAAAPRLEEDRRPKRSKERQKVAAASPDSEEPRRKNQWNLPPVEDVVSLSSDSDSKLQRIVSSQNATELEAWKVQKAAVQRKLGGTAWNPEKRLSPEALDGIRNLHKQHPDIFTTAKLSELFKVSPEAIRRILKSKWQPTAKEAEDRNKRWERRGSKIWNKMVDEGLVKTKTAKRRETKEKREKDFLRERFSPTERSPTKEKWSGVDGQRGERLPAKLGSNMGHRIL